MGWAIAVALALVAVLLVTLVQLKIISTDSVKILSEAIALVGGIAAILVFIIPAATSNNLSNDLPLESGAAFTLQAIAQAEPAAATTGAATPSPTDVVTPQPSPTQTLTPQLTHTATSTLTNTPTLSPSPAQTRMPIPSPTPMAVPPNETTLKDSFEPTTVKPTLAPFSSPVRATDAASWDSPLQPTTYLTQIESLNNRLGGKRTFRWQTVVTLQENQAFELVFWRPGEDPRDSGLGPVGYSDETAVEVDLEIAKQLISELVPGRRYVWGVLLVQEEPYERIGYVGGQHVFRLD